MQKLDSLAGHVDVPHRLVSESGAHRNFGALGPEQSMNRVESAPKGSH
jgi:hypothetical protein